jgi:uncharacterized protein YceK
MKPILLSLGSLSLMLSGCATVVETRVDSSGLDKVPSATFTIAQSDFDAPGVAAAQKLVADRLTASGFAEKDEGYLNVEVALGVRPASLAIGSSKGPGTLASAKTRRPLQNCADQEYRLGITITRVIDAAELYHGIASEYHCKMPLSQALPTLVDAAMADMGKPRGVYSIKRNATD